MRNNQLQLNSRYTLPKNRDRKSYRKWVRARMFPKGLHKYFAQ